ncbi:MULTISPECIES: cation-transporting P-type ATPase [unclassified Guyparkeria]|uniref:cation-translocating P-type ATPase n=1 Tax=unclassified Guyparkeria TaxID=2626246 RepID=UPI00073346EE|nr:MULTISPECIES: cation-transporting P-type ATPase [unclassified Guyparkeria]KTG17294.1 carbonate dehydratase [Guyparkeria sp. XI15]OAE87271.1 carbonate dehydratase [Guyparkeria sp. WRN-7]
MTEHPRPDERWHSQPAQSVLEALESGRDGLSEDQIEGRRAEYGPNRLPEARRPSAWRRLLRQFHNILIYVLLAASVVTALMAHWIDTAVILAVVLANAAIGFVQEGRAEQAMGAIRRMLALKAGVIRDGRRQAVPAEELVPGDVVLLEAGDRVPADLRLLGGRDLHVQEAILTGESVPVEKGSEPVESKASVGDRRSMAFSGTLVTRGQGRGVVVAIGEATEIGRISGLLSEVESLTTPLVEQMDRFGRWLTVVILMIAAMILLLGLFWREMAFQELFIAVVGLSVAAIPEGLPAVLTITLAIGVQAMARRQAIVRRLPAIETVGSVSVICTDKTGTLTRNEMAVTVVAVAGAEFTVTGESYSPVGQIVHDDRPVDQSEGSLLEEMARAGLLCNDAGLVQKQEAWQVEGDPMEGALIAFAGRAGLDIDAERDRWHRSDSIPFDAEHRFMATLDHDHEGHACLFVKGAPEKLLAMCARERAFDGDTRALDAEWWRDRAHDLASRGHRMLAVAARPEDPERTVLERDEVESDLVFLGLFGLSDPPRPEVPDAVNECRRAGIRVKMITGDHAGTATAIAAEIGLEHADTALTGADIEGLSDEQLRQCVLDVDVYARTSPEHKLRLVEALQALGHSVAMTGDGVNDAPALKRADAGIAMGQRGSEAAKEAADVVLADDNFASIVAGIREGRTVYDNVKKVISWTLPTNAGESMTIVVALLAGLTLPITPIQILWINLVTATTLGLALAFEPSEEGVMSRPPRPRDEGVLSGGWLIYIAVMAALFVGAVFGVYQYAISQGYSLELARTMAMNTLVVLEIVQLFFIRGLHNARFRFDLLRATRPVWLAVIGVMVAQLMITYLPAMQSVFATEAVSLFDGVLILAVGLVSFFLMEGYKVIGRRLSPSWH